MLALTELGRTRLSRINIRRFRACSKMSASHRIGPVVAEEGTGACSAAARLLCGKRQIGRAGRSSRAVYL